MNNNQWQSIQTAPKDETWVLAIEEHSTKPFIANFRKQKGGDIIFANWYADNDYVCFPILWMPLPKTPKQK
jgi:hypothetical protein